MQESLGSIQLHDSVLQRIRAFCFLLRCKASFGASFCSNMWSFTDLNLEFLSQFCSLSAGDPFPVSAVFSSCFELLSWFLFMCKMLITENLLVRSCQVHFFTLARVTSIRKVQVFPPHLIVAYRSCDQQPEVNNFLCIGMHLYTSPYTLCKDEVLITSPTESSTMLQLTDGQHGRKIR